MGMTYVERPLRQRVIALVGAYAIALASVISSFGLARAAADIATQPGGVLCHSSAGHPAPSPDEANSKICIGSCCAGCLMLVAALPPPPVTAVARQRSSGESIALLEHFVLLPSADNTSHRSRAPPLSV